MSSKSFLYRALITLLVALLGACAGTPDVTGRWREIEKKGTVEFERDGTFHSTDDMGMAVSGEYTLHENDIRFEIKHQDSSIEIIKGKVTVQGDELIFSSEDGREVMRYKRAE